MSRTEELNQTLDSLQAGSKDIEACAVIAEDGLVIAGSFPQWIEGTHIAAMSAAMLSMGNQATADLSRGAFKRLFIEWENGYLTMHAVPHGILLTMARKEANLGLVLFELSRAAQRVKDILS
jgi:predicted regulator of Ras-like GTPase activity (Roadblock/LC7/MglB family)